VCAAGLAFGTFLNKGRCFWQFSSAQPGILKEITKGANYQQFFPPLFSLAELEELKAKVAMFADLSDDQVADAYGILGGIPRSVLLLQARGMSLADLCSLVKGNIAMMGEAGWKVRRSAARAARTWPARAACFWHGCEGAHAGHDHDQIA